MTMQILVPLDGSAFSEQAVERACEIAQRARGELHLVRVQEPPVPIAAEIGSPGFIAAGPYDEITRTIGEYLVTQAIRISRGFGLTTRVVTLHGAVGPAIAGYVARAGINLVVMTSHGRTGVGRVLLGSVADALARTLTVPILLLRPVRSANGLQVQPLNPRRVLIPLDGSEFAEQVIEQAVELGWPARAKYTLLQVLNPPHPVVRGDEKAQAADSLEFQLVRDQAREYLEGAANRLRQVGLRVDTVVVTHPDTARGIIQESMACEADLIAMTTHGRSGWQRLLMGSVAQRVLHTARLPLLVLKGRKTEVEETALVAASCAV